VISDDVLEKAIRLASEEYETVWFIWHGGEPLTLPLKFYKNAISLQERYFGKDTHRTSNTIQTNGTLIDKKFMNFCREKKINVGVSYEGPCNDILREGTDAVEKNIQMMRRDGHRFSVCATVCRESTKEMIRMYDSFVRNGTTLSYAPVIRLGDASPEMIPDAEEYADMCIETFNEWLYDTNANVPLMPFMNYVLSALGNDTPEDCARSSCLMKWLCVHPNGDLYPCAKGCPSELRLCNISDIEKLSDAFATDAMRDILSKTVERREKCVKGCELYAYCGGGCSVDALSEGSMSVTGASCIIFKKVFTHILNTVNKILGERHDLSLYNALVREALIGKLVNPAAGGAGRGN
jgi:uncharacterized protein